MYIQLNFQSMEEKYSYFSWLEWSPIWGNLIFEFSSHSRQIFWQNMQIINLSNEKFNDFNWKPSTIKKGKLVSSRTKFFSLFVWNNSNNSLPESPFIYTQNVNPMVPVVTEILGNFLSIFYFNFPWFWFSDWHDFCT